MPWSFRRDLHIALNASYGNNLIESPVRAVQLQTPPDFVVGDLLPVRIYLWDVDTLTPEGLPTAVETPEGTVMTFSGRPAGAPVDSPLLFLSSNLTRGDWETHIFEGTLDLNTAELAAHLAQQSTGSITILGEIELRSADVPPKRQSIQFDITARRQVYAGTEGEAAALLNVPIGIFPPKVGWMKVEGASLETLNGYWTPSGTANGKPQYRKVDESSGDPTGLEAVAVIPGPLLVYTAARWRFVFEFSPVTEFYRSTSDVPSPELATYEGVANPAPVPVVAKWETPSPPYFRTGLDVNSNFSLFVHSWDAGASKRVWKKALLQDVDAPAFI